MLAEAWNSSRSFTTQKDMGLSGLKMALHLLLHQRFGLLFIQNNEHEWKQNPSNPANSGALPQSSSSLSTGWEEEERESAEWRHKPNHRNGSQFRKKALPKAPSTGRHKASAGRALWNCMCCFCKASLFTMDMTGKKQKVKLCCLRVAELWKIEKCFDSIKLFQ